MKLHPRQRIALTHPCTYADDTLHPRFFAAEASDGWLLATLLSVNK